jgi:hypothetical protein
MHGKARHTKGMLYKKDLLKNKHGRIVSRRLHNKAKREKRLVRAGFLTRKGHFGFIKKHQATQRRRRHSRGKHTRRRRHRGGAWSTADAASYHGDGSTSGVALQIEAGQHST